MSYVSTSDAVNEKKMKKEKKDYGIGYVAQGECVDAVSNFSTFNATREWVIVL